MSVSRRALLGSSVLGAMALASCATGDAITERVAPPADPMFTEPYVDVDEWRDAPRRHRFVHGGFRGTDARFVFYFPPPEFYQGRFFQYVSPVPADENRVFRGFGNEDYVSFSFESGAYGIGTNMGGNTANPTNQVDPTIGGYRASAAAAEYSRVLAVEMYGRQQRPYGYVFGGSGGAYRTIGCLENTTSWDGGVPFVMGSPVAVPYDFTVRANALRVLKHKFPQIADALDPGGSGDPYAGLNEEEHGALMEATKFGFPLEAWTFHQGMGLGALTHLFHTIRAKDPSYFTDFWTVPGYLGANPPPSLLAARVQRRTRVRQVIMSDQAAVAGINPPAMFTGFSSDAATAWRMLQQFNNGGRPYAVALRLPEPMPAPTDLRMGDIRVRSGAAAGQTLAAEGFDRDFILLSASPTVLEVGDEIEIDNSDYLALQTYHRHQVPPTGFSIFDQFRNPDGTPKYPQRTEMASFSFNQSAAGSVESARFHGKMIVLEGHIDFDAFPWHAHWYRQQVEQNVGARADHRLRVWMVDKATHGGPNTSRMVTYEPVIQQALRDLAAWVESGVAPSPSTNYQENDGQIVLAAGRARRGIQPVITTFTANGAARAEVRPGQSVTFNGIAEMPENTGPIVEAVWDFEGRGQFTESSEVTPAESVTLNKTHTYTTPGVYFVGLRVASHRGGDARAAFGKLYNLARVRVVVS